MKTNEKKTHVKNSIVRLFLSVMAISLQIGIWVSVLLQFYQRAKWIPIMVNAVACIVAFAINGTRKNAGFKMPWIFLLLMLPVFGLVMFVISGLSGGTIRMRQCFQEIDREIFCRLPENEAVWHQFQKKSPAWANIAKYLKKVAKYPVYHHTSVQYFSEASDGFEEQKRCLKRAKSYIYMEYHAIENRESFLELKEILADKVKEGVTVRLIYDDVGSISFLNKDFIREMKTLGIQCRVFNPVLPVLNIFLNNRDHRKLTVIDGQIGFTGGYNLANEYFNRTHPYGHWKDTGIKLEGDAVVSLEAIFLEMWNGIRTGKEQLQMGRLFETHWKDAESEGFIVPFADSPLDSDYVGEDVYISMLNSATEYAFFMTPYLIITDEMTRAMTMAARRGVDVRIITPGIPDKKLVYKITRSYYPILMDGGVKLYEYTPGFCHGKMCICDDVAAVVGTMNLDYRSFYHHFENSCYLYGYREILNIKNDFLETFSKCRCVSNRRSKPLRAGQVILRLFSPLF